MALLGTSTSELGQEVADVTGNAYKPVGAPETPPEAIPAYDAEAVGGVLAGQAPVASGLDYVDQDKSTVAGQLGTLLGSDSPYIKQAEEAGKEYGASRGMLNTAASAGFARKEAYKAALPVATTDAQTYATAQGRQQAADIAQTQTQTEGIVSGEMTAQRAKIAESVANVSNQFQAAMQGASEANKVLLQDMQNNYNTFNLEMQNEQQRFLQMENVTAEKAQSIRTQSSSIMQNYQISVENLMTDPDFMNLGPAAMNNAINQMQNLAKNSIGFLGASSGIDMDPFIDAYLADLEVATPEEV